MAKRKKKSSTAKPRFQWLRDMSWPNIQRGLLALAWVLGIGGVGAACWYGVPRLEAHVAGATAPTSIEIHFVDPPAWVRHELEARLVLVIEPLLTTDPFNRDELMHIRSALLDTGWYERIHQVRRVRADAIEIDGDFVDPYALIRDGEGDHLVDPQGRLLPRTYPFGQADQFVVITNSRFPRPGRIGMQWEGADISAALRLLRLIEAEPWREQVASINISGVIRGQPIRLITDRGSRIIWGSAPGEEAAMEALADRKLFYLNYLYEQHGHIDMNHRGEIDITDMTTVNNREADIPAYDEAGGTKR